MFVFSCMNQILKWQSPGNDRLALVSSRCAASVRFHPGIGDEFLQKA
jgi:hypothetical protein